MASMNDDDLSKLLTKVPRQMSSSTFTDRVLERVQAVGGKPRGRRLRVVAAAGAVLMGLWLGASALGERVERRRNAERIDSMRTEYRALQLELEELRWLASEAEPVLELGSTEQVDIVIDLRELSEAQGRARAQPTVHTPR
jgi:hypothetical protein